MKLGYTCQSQFRVCQYERDLAILKRILLYLGCGTLITPSKDRNRYDISISNLNSLIDIIIPFFEKYLIYGAKYLDFKDFSKGVLIMQKKRAFNSSGFGSVKRFSLQYEYVQKVLMFILFYKLLF